jgi:hypothetical protein
VNRPRPFRALWLRVVRLSRACLVATASAFFAVSAIWWQIVTLPTMAVATMIAAGWCIVVGGEEEVEEEVRT